MGVVDPDADAALAPSLQALAAAYAIFAVFAVYKLVRLHRATRVWTRQKGLHYLVLLCGLGALRFTFFPSSPPLSLPPPPPSRAVRCAFFAVVPTWDGVYFYVRMTSSDPVDTGYYVLEEVPTLLLLTLYSQQLLVWAQSYHTATNTIDTFTRVVVRAVWAFNAVVYVSQALIWGLYDHTAGAIDGDAWSLTAAVLHTSAFLTVAVALLGYGMGVRRSVRSVPVGLQLRVRQMRAILCVTLTCSLAFLARCVALVVASYAGYTDADGFDESLTAGDVAGSVLFFLITELVPLAVVLRYNGTVPGSRLSRKSSSSSALRTLRSPSTGSSTAPPATAGSPGGGGKSTPRGAAAAGPGSPGFNRFRERVGRSMSMSRGLALRLGFRAKGPEDDVGEGEAEPLASSPMGSPDTESLLSAAPTTGGGRGGGYGTGGGGGGSAAAGPEFAAARAAAAASGPATIL
jgi:hypothetical protein